jgi:ribonuclease III
VADGNPVVAPVHGHQLTSRSGAEAILGHHFKRPELLQEALTHRSAAHGGRQSARGRGRPSPQHGVSNERLEFVGDRVLGLLMAEWLAERFPAEQEGELGRRLAHLVSQPVLAAIAAEIGLPAALDVAPGESRAGVRRLATVLADAMEAAIGAVFLDAGLEPARRFVRSAWDGAIRGQAEPPKDSKTGLQEWAQAHGLGLPVYQVASREGPSHAPVFVVTVAVGKQSGTGTGASKRAAEQAAAEHLLGKLTT